MKENKITKEEELELTLSLQKLFRRIEVDEAIKFYKKGGCIELYSKSIYDSKLIPVNIDKKQHIIPKK